MTYACYSSPINKQQRVNSMFYTMILNELPPEYVENVQPFLFVPNPTQTDKNIPKTSDDAILACPFPIFSYEVEGMTLTHSDEGVSIVAVVVREIGVNDYEFHVLCKDNHYQKAHILNSLKGDEIYDSIFDLTHVYLERLNQEKTGTFNSIERLKYKDSSGKKQTYKAKGVIYVSGNNQPSHTLRNKHNYTVTPLNSWSVMSHWRRLKNPESLGKGRDGEGTVTGYTWIGSYKKGDTNLPEKIKTRRIS